MFAFVEGAAGALIDILVFIVIVVVLVWLIRMFLGGRP